MRKKRRWALLRRWCSAAGAAALCFWEPATATPGGAAKQWLAEVENPDLRLEKAYELKDVTGEGEAALPTLLGALAHSDPYVRSAAAGALGEIEAEPSRLIPSLVEALYDPDPRVTAQAEVALAKIGAVAVPALVEVVESGMRPAGPWKESLIRRSRGTCGGYWIYRPAVAAALALADIGAPAVSSLVATLQLAPRTDLGFDTYLPSLVALRRIGSPAIPSLAQALEGPDLRFRLLAAIALARIRFDRKSAGLATTALDTQAPAANASLSGGLANLRGTGAPGNAAGELGDRQRVGRLLLESLGQIGPSAVPTLVAALQDPELAISAIHALASLGPDAATAVPALLAVRGRANRPQAIHALASIGTTEAVRNLAVLAQSDGADPGTDAVEAVDALPRIGPAAVPILSRALRRRSLQYWAATALWNLGPDEGPAVPALVRMLALPESKAEDHRIQALAALKAAGPVAREAVPALIDLLRQATGSEGYQLRRFALDALRAIGPAAKRAVPTVISILEQPPESGGNVELATLALRTLGAIGPQREAVRAAASALARCDVQWEAAATLRDFGPAAREATPAINRLRETRGETACAADLALLGIRPGPVSAAALVQDRCGSSWRAIVIYERMGHEGVPFLVDLLQGKDAPESAARALGRMGLVASAARPALETALRRSSGYLRKVAADALVEMGAEAQGAVATVANEDAVLSHADTFEVEIVRSWWGPIHCDPLGGTFFGGPPPFPWPPPHFSAHDVLSLSFAGTEGATLGTVHDRLSAALRAGGFEDNGTFSVPGGFALVTRLERILPDGSADPVGRWSAGKDMPGNLLGYLGHLFLERPGEFRLIAFLVTTARYVETGRTTIEEGEARTLSLRGGRVLPHEIAVMPLAGRTCHVLVYHFTRRRGGASLIQPSELSTRQHLRQAGLWRQLSATP